MVEEEPVEPGQVEIVTPLDENGNILPALMKRVAFVWLASFLEYRSRAGGSLFGRTEGSQEGGERPIHLGDATSHSYARREIDRRNDDSHDHEAGKSLPAGVYPIDSSFLAGKQYDGF